MACTLQMTELMCERIVAGGAVVIHNSKCGRSIGEDRIGETTIIGLVDDQRRQVSAAAVASGIDGRICSEVGQNGVETLAALGVRDLQAVDQGQVNIDAAILVSFGELPGVDIELREDMRYYELSAEYETR